MTPDEAPAMPASQPDGSALLRRVIRLVPVVALDALLIIASYAAALALRFDGAIPRETMIFFLGFALVCLGGLVFFVRRTRRRAAAFAEHLGFTAS